MNGTTGDATENDMAERLLDLGSGIAAVLQELFPRDETRDDFLTGAFWHHMGSGGKRIRPALCLLTCKELGGDPEKALYFAAAVEVMHNMFLVHDDLEDGDEVRRDAPAVWVKYGAANAVNLGDYMLGRAYSLILQSRLNDATKCRLAKVFTGTYEKTCRGQAMDLNFRGSPDMDVEKYLELVQLKTADYLVLGMIGGAIIAGASRCVLDSIRRLGRFMGPAFQIRDDVIDLTCGKGRGGELGNDIREGKPSILFAHALGAASEEGKKFLLDTARRRREETGPATVQKVIDFYEQCGSVEFATAKAEQLTVLARQAVEDIPVENKEVFRRIVHYMAERTK